MALDIITSSRHVDSVEYNITGIIIHKCNKLGKKNNAVGYSEPGLCFTGTSQTLGSHETCSFMESIAISYPEYVPTINPDQE